MTVSPAPVASKNGRATAASVPASGGSGSRSAVRAPGSPGERRAAARPSLVRPALVRLPDESGGIVAKRHRQPSAGDVGDGDPTGSSWIECRVPAGMQPGRRSRIPSVWRTERACPRRPLDGAPALLARSEGGGSPRCTRAILPGRRRPAKTIGCSDFEGARGRLPKPRFTRDNCIYREQNCPSGEKICQCRLRARMPGTARNALPRTAGIRQLIDRKGIFGSSGDRAGLCRR